jgi:threonine aldolase
MLGGAMRQTGIFAAAALHGIDHHRARLAEDHANARVLALALAGSAAVRLDLATVQTNIVVFHLADGSALDGAGVVARAREHGVLLNAFAARTLRAVTHLDVTAAQVERAATVLRAILG